MQGTRLRILAPLLRFFFSHLYTTFAWAYDLVAWTTSIGQWRTWQTAALAAAPAGRLLELGHGPGHLLLNLARRGQEAIGVDVSPQMGRLAARRLRRSGMPPNVIRAKAQALPLPYAHFDGVLSTFPSEYVFDPDTLAEVQRVLRPGGSFIVIPMAEITGTSLPDRFAAWLYRVTGQFIEPLPNWSEPLERLGYSVRLDRVHQARAVVLRVVAHKAAQQGCIRDSLAFHSKGK
jgi:ubiquinone/menaquinone biosynthesis C-methylase UbiE